MAQTWRGIGKELSHTLYFPWKLSKHFLKDWVQFYTLIKVNDRFVLKHFNGLDWVPVRGLVFTGAA